MDLSTRYMGLDLPHPFVPGASPLVCDLDTAKRLEDAGAAALVLPSLFEEQIRAELGDRTGTPPGHGQFYAMAASPEERGLDGRLGPDEYLEQISRTKHAVDIPVIASINGNTPSGWLWAAALMEQAGADALELNVYEVASDPDETGQDVEDRVTETVTVIKSRVDIPIAVKLSPYYSSLSHLARRLEEGGADALVLFNRFFQADIDADEMRLRRTILPSTPDELLLRLSWTAILSSRVDISIAITGGVHSGTDAVKAILAGAHSIQVVSALLQNGPEHLTRLVAELEQWMELHGCTTLESVRGLMNLARCSDPKTYERLNYMEVLSSWKPWQ